MCHPCQYTNTSYGVSDSGSSVQLFLATRNLPIKKLNHTSEYYIHRILKKTRIFQPNKSISEKHIIWNPIKLNISEVIQIQITLNSQKSLP